MNKFNNLHVFDLDGTVIDSFHRVKPCLRPDGDLDLHLYKSTACTHDQIMGDRLLPLAAHMKQMIASGEKVAICTARLLTNSDYYYLRKNGLRVNTICSRDQLGKHFDHSLVKAIYGMKDADYKRAYFQRLQTLYPLHNLIIYDDHDGVLETAETLGLQTFNARDINQMIEAAYRSGFSDASDDYENEIDSLLQSLVVNE